ncbi:MAG TPA: trypsin-like peptidase domain-containing protein [Pseudolysinimonas sp.]|nr:trypsin-like peptidase domain-containing protein [Pseudolysinimonas sp.]
MTDTDSTPAGETTPTPPAPASTPPAPASTESASTASTPAPPRFSAEAAAAAASQSAATGATSPLSSATHDGNAPTAVIDPGAPTGFAASGAPGAPGISRAPGAPAAEAATSPKKRRILVPVVAALAVGAVIGGASGAGVVALVGANNGSTQQGASTPQTVTINDTAEVTAVTAIASKASPSVVTISVSTSSSGGTGSGVILSKDGYVLTNTHVVTLDGASSKGDIEVTTYDGHLYTAKVIGIDPIVDLAVIKLTDASGLTPMKFADSDKLNVGDQAVAIGAPLGLANTVTDGIVSALNRSIQIASSAVPDNAAEDGSQGDSNNGNGPFDFWNFNQDPNSSATQSASISLPVVQTDAAINPGNSGGALVDGDAALIGVNVAIASTGSSSATSQSGSIGVGFAIPSNLAQRVANEIIKNGKATHGLLGASVRDATSKDGSTVGAVISEISDGGGAEKAGLKPDDVVTSFAGTPITSSTDLTAQVRALAGGTTTSITYTRAGKNTTTDVKLGTL